MKIAMKGAATIFIPLYTTLKKTDSSLLQPRAYKIVSSSLQWLPKMMNTSI